MRASTARPLLAAVLMLLARLAASGDDGSATVSGNVASLDGARLPHASITLTEPRSGRQVRTTSDRLGAFTIGPLPAGTYSLVAEFPGLATREIAEVAVPGSGDVHLDIALAPLGLREVVTVSAALPRDSLEVTAVRESSARDVGELLSESPGVWKVRKGGIASDVVMRGLQSRDLNVLVDGERLYGACPNVMDPPAFHVDFAQVERVDIGKGPFDVRYQGSFGGIVNVVTRRPSQGWSGTVSLAAGSFGFMNPSATVSFGGERLSLLGGLSYRTSAPYRDGRGGLITENAGYRNDAVDSDAFRAATLWGRAAWIPADGHRLEASYTRQRTDHILYPYLLMDAVWDDADRLSFDYERLGSGGSAMVTARAYWARVDHWMTDGWRNSSAGAPRTYSMGTDASTATTGARVELLLATTTVGAETFRRNWNAATVMAGMGAYAPQYSVPDVNIDSSGAFVEHARSIGARASLDLGARLDWITTAVDARKANLALYTAYHGAAPTSRTDFLPSGRAKLSIGLSRSVDAAIAVGHTARVAQPTERFLGLRRKGTDWVGNPALEPARNTGVDVSLILHGPRITVTANGYVNELQDYIAVYGAARAATVPGVMNTAARSYANVDARQWGFEASGSISLRPQWSVSGDVSWVRGTMTPRPTLGMTATNLAEMPPLRARLLARFDDGRVFAELEGVANAEQARVDRSLGETPTDSFAFANLSAGLRRGRLTATIGVANLFDSWFVEHLSYQRDPYRSGARVAEPGRNLFTNVTWAF